MPVMHGQALPIKNPVPHPFAHSREEGKVEMLHKTWVLGCLESSAS